MRESALLDLNKVIASQFAPVEVLKFFDNEGKFRISKKRLGNAWSQKDCVKILKRIVTELRTSDRSKFNEKKKKVEATYSRESEFIQELYLCREFALERKDYKVYISNLDKIAEIESK